ncbi:hypothetical protein BH09BAC3_BH09BAC3_21030 [soil metagenome]
MKTIKSPLLGFKKLDDSNSETLMHQLQEVLSQHQEILINRLLRDLPTYLDYRFHLKASKGELEEIREKLVFLKNKNVDLEMFGEVVSQVKSNATTHLSNELFYSGIDKLLQVYVKDTALSF